MNTNLLLANATALAILLSFHFAPASNAPESVAQRMPHYLQVQKQPQLAILTDKSSFAPRTVSAPDQALPAQLTERLVF
ncbi:hypothetical protein C2E19_22355 [Pseudomonas sp. DTU12.3]|uniref:hypothetical protein n=1 Tax=Pseudomonas sp. DTU12.3 TaxID=2073078 RepID=UPI001010AD50|nr:hypothetical protein [Pseudomonas sp. DTU12.3]QAX86412.1 hypothetical protein C2E19_22355 [Pseudomonas sp. DTU12.3]